MSSLCSAIALPNNTFLVLIASNTIEGSAKAKAIARILKLALPGIEPMMTEISCQCSTVAVIRGTWFNPIMGREIPSVVQKYV